jgi:hypothetical protein
VDMASCQTPPRYAVLAEALAVAPSDWAILGSNRKTTSRSLPGEPAISLKDAA